MKRILASLLTFCCIAASSMAQNEPDQYVDFQIVAQGHVDTPIYRAPAIVPVQGYYVSSLSALYLCFLYDFGIINVRIENTTTGDFLLESIPTSSGVHFITSGLNPGLYIIWILTPNGSQYFSELQI